MERSSRICPKPASNCLAGTNLEAKGPVAYQRSGDRPYLKEILTMCPPYGGMRANIVLGWQAAAA